MPDEFDPIPEPSGALVPPMRYPPTAAGLATLPPPRPARVPTPARREPLLQAIRRAVDRALDVADVLADALRAKL
jgi:hypothetical protein